MIKKGKNMNDFCRCTELEGIHTGFDDEWGYWDICDTCGKKLEDGHHYYDHYDGEDHDDII